MRPAGLCAPELVFNSPASPCVQRPGSGIKCSPWVPGAGRDRNQGAAGHTSPAAPRSAAAASAAAPAPPAARGARARCGAVAGSSSGSRSSYTSSLDVETWEATYGHSPLHYGLSLEQGIRETMEDAAQVVPNAHYGFFFATVFDGHGGFAAAEYLQQNLYKIFSRVLDKSEVQPGLTMSMDDVPGLACPLNFTHVLTESFKDADDDLLKWMHVNAPDEERTSGCTATTVLVRKDMLVVANVGDSRAVLSRGGRALDLSTEHRVWGKTRTVQAEIERIESVGGWVDDGRVLGVLAVSRAFGDMEFKGEEGLRQLMAKGLEYGLWDQKFVDSKRFTGFPVTSQPDVTELKLHDGDEFVIVASDGLWDVMDSQEVVKLARKELQRGSSPQAVCERLSALAVKRGSQDNIGVILIDLGKVDWGAEAAKPQGFFSALFSR